MSTEPIKIDRFEFEDPNGRTAECGLEIIPAAEARIAVIATELRANPGMSVTNSAEHLATIVCRTFGLAPRLVTWIEWYGYPVSGNPLARRAYDLVEFATVAGVVNGSIAFRQPRWRPMSEADWARLAIAPRSDTLLFETGGLVITSNARETLADVDVLDCIARHVRGDWGDLCAEDRKENDRALRGEGRLFSTYADRGGTKFYVITEWNRAVTTVLLPEDY